MTKRNYYAGHCDLGWNVKVSHWWNVFAFDNKKERDEFVKADNAKRRAFTRPEMEKALGRLRSGSDRHYAIILNKQLLYPENFPNGLVEIVRDYQDGYLHEATTYYLSRKSVKII